MIDDRRYGQKKFYWRHRRGGTNTKSECQKVAAAYTFTGVSKINAVDSLRIRKTSSGLIKHRDALSSSKGFS